MRLQLPEWPKAGPPDQWVRVAPGYGRLNQEYDVLLRLTRAD